MAVPGSDWVLCCVDLHDVFQRDWLANIGIRTDGREVLFSTIGMRDIPILICGLPVNGNHTAKIVRFAVHLEPNFCVVRFCVFQGAEEFVLSVAILRITW